MSVDGSKASHSRVVAQSRAPAWAHATTLSAKHFEEMAAHGIHGEMVSVELWHSVSRKLSPVPLGRCDVDLLSEQLRATGKDDDSVQSSKRWHRVAMTDGCGDVSRGRRGCFV